jgi:hypothetical protein
MTTHGPGDEQPDEGWVLDENQEWTQVDKCYT